jgi:hypothetical protein
MMMLYGRHVVVDPDVPETLRAGPRHVVLTPKELAAALDGDAVIMAMLEYRPPPPSQHGRHLSRPNG